MREMIRSKVSLPLSFNAFVTDFAPCSFVAYSRSPEMRWSRAILRCFADPCSRTKDVVKPTSTKIQRMNLLCWTQYDPH